MDTLSYEGYEYELKDPTKELSENPEIKITYFSAGATPLEDKSFLDLQKQIREIFEQKISINGIKLPRLSKNIYFFIMRHN